MLVPSSPTLIFSSKATILILNGKKYVAKCAEGDTYDKEKGLYVCLAKSAGYTFDQIQSLLDSAITYPSGKKATKKNEANRVEVKKEVLQRDFNLKDRG